MLFHVVMLPARRLVLQKLWCTWQIEREPFSKNTPWLSSIISWYSFQVLNAALERTWHFMFCLEHEIWNVQRWCFLGPKKLVETCWNKSLNGLQVQYHSEAQKEVGLGQPLGQSYGQRRYHTDARIPHMAYVLQCLLMSNTRFPLDSTITLASRLESDSMEWNISNDTALNTTLLTWCPPFGRAKRMWSTLTNIEKYITTSKRMWPGIQWCNHMNVCDVITLMYIMMHMYLYNIIYTILEIYGTVWTWI